MYVSKEKILNSIKNKFANKVKIISEETISEMNYAVTILLYDTLLFKIFKEQKFENHYSLHGGFLIGGHNLIIKFLSTDFSGSRNADEENLQQMLEKFEWFCQLRLPDKVLNKYL